MLVSNSVRQNGKTNFNPVFVARSNTDNPRDRPLDLEERIARYSEMLENGQRIFEPGMYIPPSNWS